MSISISSLASSTTASPYASSQSRKSTTTDMVDNLFSQLDTKGQGYLEKSDLESALSTLDSTSSSASADDVFSALDSDGDGKVTKDEMSTNLQALADELDSQFNAMRVSNGMTSSSTGSDEGYTADELTSIASSTNDSQLSSLMSTIAENFDDADGDGDGKVTSDEAMSYMDSTRSASQTAGAGNMPPPPPDEEDTGFTADELTSIGSSTNDSQLSSLMNTLATNFDDADANSDGKVTHDEAMSYMDSTSSTSNTASSTSDTSTTASTTASDSAVMKRIMDLMQAYNPGTDTTNFSSLLSSLSVSA